MEHSVILAGITDNNLEIGGEALAERIARWAENGELHTTTGLIVLFAVD